MDRWTGGKARLNGRGFPNKNDRDCAPCCDGGNPPLQPHMAATMSMFFLRRTSAWYLNLLPGLENCITAPAILSQDACRRFFAQQRPRPAAWTGQPHHGLTTSNST
eukprot:360794-Chlamydomonas_euryale.AAC.9